ncbi:hypothetical protein BJ684DRAFT_19704 [Piptocephalis cylindrospora]|uniref:Uncharacterized protein n=1 Tax=Piptocephalis cylindrospora TaxID=1907219 RepID=A0A4P9Y553_9FUNG|nr:hypothetical protein BJ684DRAFT_19704 [Piptocephalis cylindrospora]|eukprot:RKP13832.1 hypothetical protein BJ684DRAFT_19704 [Piptocephalis cylindrospora]
MTSPTNSRSQEGLDLTKVLVGSAAFGLVGAGAGVLASAYRDIPNRAIVPAATLNMMGIGAIFFVARDSLVREQRQRNREAGLLDGVERDADLMFASVVSGGLAGALTTMLGRGPRAVPLTTMICMFIAGVGQYASTRFHHYRHDRILKEMSGSYQRRSVWDSLLPSNSNVWAWLPVQKLSDAEVLGYLQEEKYRVDRELTLLAEADVFGDEDDSDGGSRI